jgi:non-specific serine/threonine protein kinase/serine/threonine-protein kinase
VVCEEEPQRPSTAVTKLIARSTGGLVSTQAAPVSTGKPREEETERLRRRLSGDLDNIIMKALAKEPQRRYASVDQFSEDIRRHLEGLPVLARPDTFGYRTSKFIKRHKASVVAAVLIFVSLVAGIAGTAWQARKARQQRERAERRFNEGRSLANAFMFELDEKIQNLPGSTEARRFLVTKSLQYLDGLVGEASGDLSLQRELASAYEKVGDVQGGYDFGSVGDSGGALESYQKAHAIREAVAAADQNSVDYRYELARSHDNLGVAFAERGERSKGLDHHRKALEIRESIHSANPSEKRAQTALGTSYFYVATALVSAGDLEGAREARRTQMILFEEVARRDDATATDRRNLALSYKYYGGMLEREGKQDEALDLYRKAVAIEEARAQQDPTNTQVRLDLSFTYASVGHAQLIKKEFPGSLESYTKALALREAVVAADPANESARAFVARAHTSIAAVQEESGDAAGAIERYRKALSIRESMAARDPGSADLRISLANTYADLGQLNSRLAADPKTPAANRKERLRDARTWYQRGLEIFNDLQSKGKLAGSDSEKPGNLSRELAKVEEGLGKAANR